MKRYRCPRCGWQYDADDDIIRPTCIGGAMAAPHPQEDMLADPVPVTPQGETAEIEKRLNAAIRECICRKNDPYGHKHYSDPPYSCARCGHKNCPAFTPLNGYNVNDAIHDAFLLLRALAKAEADLLALRREKDELLRTGTHPKLLAAGVEIALMLGQAFGREACDAEDVSLVEGVRRLIAERDQLRSAGETRQQAIEKLPTHIWHKHVSPDDICRNCRAVVYLADLQKALTADADPPQEPIPTKDI